MPTPLDKQLGFKRATQEYILYEGYSYQSTLGDRVVDAAIALGIVTYQEVFEPGKGYINEPTIEWLRGIAVDDTDEDPDELQVLYDWEQLVREGLAVKGMRWDRDNDTVRIWRLRAFRTRAPQLV